MEWGWEKEHGLGDGMELGGSGAAVAVEPGGSGAGSGMGLGVLQLLTGATGGSGSWQDRDGGAEGVHSWQSQPTRARRGPSGLLPPLGPSPLLCSQPKSSFFSPLESPWRPGCLPGIPGCGRTLQEEFPRPPEGSGHSQGYGEGTCPPQPPWPHPCPPLSPPALSVKETFLVLSLHNKLRSKVQPPAANMQKLVSPLAAPVSPTFGVTSSSQPMPGEAGGPWVIHRRC